MRRFLATLLITLCAGVAQISLFSCNQQPQEQSFYEDEMASFDVWRLPIVEPYELVTAYCCTGWNFGKNSALGQGFEKGFSVDSVNVDNGHVLLYSFDSQYHGYHILNIETSREVYFRNTAGFRYFCSENGIEAKLHSAESAHRHWREFGLLPWSDELQLDHLHP